MVSAGWRDAWFERVRMPLSVRHIGGPRHFRWSPDQVVVMCLAKDAHAHIAAFIAHYQQLGVAGIVLLDNGSSDDTIEQASAYPQVSVYQTRLPFRGHNRQMRRFLLRRFGARDCWVLMVDVDELFDYPCSDRMRLDGLLRYLRQRRYTAMVCYLLDMFPEGPLDVVDPDVPMRLCSPLYDLSAVHAKGYFEPDAYGGERWVAHNTLANPAIQRLLGGIRKTAFDLPEVYLIKHPLLLLDGRVMLVHQHFVDHGAIADISGVLYHYKFVPGFRVRVDTAVNTGAYADESWEYRRYQRALDRDPSLSLKTPESRRLLGVDELVEQGFLQVTQDYLTYVEGAACSG